MDKEYIYRYLTSKKHIYTTRTHTHTMGYYSTLKRKEILPLATILMNLEDFMLSEVKLDTKRQTLHSIR